MRDIVEYWRTGFDWRPWEAKLNSFRQFTLPIGGIDLHFIHEPSRKAGAPPLLISHGWPGSVFEFHKIIPLLTEHFTVIAPSLPGYTLSFRPGQKRFTIQEIVPLYAELMTALGYERFCVQGGDWGAFVASVLGAALPATPHRHPHQPARGQPRAEEQSERRRRRPTTGISPTGSRKRPPIMPSRAPSRRRSPSRFRIRRRGLRPGSWRNSAPGPTTTARPTVR